MGAWSVLAAPLGDVEVTIWGDGRQDILATEEIVIRHNGEVLLRVPKMKERAQHIWDRH